MEVVYNLPAYARIVLWIMLAALSFLTLFNVTLNVYRRPKGMMRYQTVCLSAYLFGFLAFTVAAVPLIFSTPVKNIISNIPLTLFTVLGYAVAVPAAAAVVYGIRWKKVRFRAFLDAAVLIFMLPAFSFIVIYPYMLFVFVMYFICRAVFSAFAAGRAINNGITPYSLKQALDKLDEGILFANPKDKIIFINGSMQGFLKENLSGAHEKASSIWQGLIDLQEYSGGRVTDGGSITVYAGAQTLMFTNKTAGKFGYRQISYVDVTEQESLIKEIEAINRGEGERQEQLKETLAMVETIERDREVLRLKSSLHDTISQRLSILHQFLENIGQYEDLGQLKGLIVSMLPGVYDKPETGYGGVLLDDLISAYGLIGVTLNISGSLPEDESKAKLFADIIRECSTNAVRHGGATEININIVKTDSRTRMIITNNGMPPAKIIEGNGITGMRRAISNTGGSLEISLKPEFTVAAELSR